MKRLLLLASLLYITSCSNPEDKATGNSDGKRFNADEKAITNGGATPAGANKSDVEKPDTSVSPATSNKNLNSTTNGTNRSYGTGRDSSQH